MAEATGTMTPPKVTPTQVTPPVPQKPGDPSKTSGSKPVEAPFKIEPLQKSSKWLNMLIYGDHGAGKTTLAGTAADVAEMCDVLYLNIDGGELALEDNPMIDDVDAILNVRVTSFMQAAHVQEFLKAHCRFRDLDDEANLKRLQSMVTGVPVEEIERVYRFRTVIIDSLAELEQYNFNAIMGNTDQKLAEGDVETADWPVFRKNMDMVLMMVRAFRDLPIHFLATCPDKFNDLSKVQGIKAGLMYTPRLTGQLAAKISGFFDIVGWLIMDSKPNQEGEFQRRIWIQPAPVGGVKFVAKNRRAIYKEHYWDNPTMEQILIDCGLKKAP
jgi:hypothetical protein